MRMMEGRHVTKKLCAAILGGAALQWTSNGSTPAWRHAVTESQVLKDWLSNSDVSRIMSSETHG